MKEEKKEKKKERKKKERKIEKIETTTERNGQHPFNTSNKKIKTIWTIFYRQHQFADWCVSHQS